ncbi:hypothetical protein HYFRA_00003169 [Hymenoscyphus fraxineus]|uniref:Zn(2)-C6 fungal-type domain-containing protein n=1 Tax=Hymenoscyphus fraxineus TaxID=746836 RepID=A0A9N9KUP4_9HELO|nr:hypothetical protein HYFRA_00003169 [Hymenoscyphus fraxineus]
MESLEGHLDISSAEIRAALLGFTHGRETLMFSTISFAKSGRSKATKERSAPYYGQSTKRSACETCRVLKAKAVPTRSRQRKDSGLIYFVRQVKCCRGKSSGSGSGCTRCLSLKIPCEYDGVKNSRPQLSRTSYEADKSMSSSRRESLSASPNKKDNSSHDVVVDEEPSLTDDGQKTVVGSSSTLFFEDGGATIEAMDDTTTFGDFEDSLDWALTSDDYTSSSDPKQSLFAFDFSPNHKSTSANTIQHSDPALSTSIFPPSNLSQNIQGTSSSFSLASTSSPYPCSCSCSVRLSSSLFSLNGYLRHRSIMCSPESPRGNTMSLEQSLSRILTAHTSAAKLGNDMTACASQCLTQASNAVQWVMLIEQLVDLYAALVGQLSDVRAAVSDGTPDAEIAATMPMRVGEYMIESAVEKEAMLTQLVNQRMKTLGVFAVTHREQLGSASGVGECRGRLNAAVQKLAILRDRSNRI